MTDVLRQPLDGVRVVDLTRVLAGPFASMLLADMGAEVIKIEPPGGDPVRQQGTLIDGFSAYFASFNRNKKSVVLDLRSEEGKERLGQLIASADVLVENFRPGVLAKMGFGPERLDALNPRLVVGSVTGYGADGPYADRPVFDFITQAMSGFMAVTGEADGDPMRTGLPITDLVGGLYCAFGIVNALRARDLNGTGQHVDAAMMSGIMSFMAYLASEQLATGQHPPRSGNDHPLVAPYGLFAARDGQVAVAPSNDAVLRKFLTVLGLGHVMEDARFDTNAKRIARRAELRQLIETQMCATAQAEWIDRLNAAGVPSGRVQTLEEALDDPQARAQEMVIEVEHPGHGPVRMLGYPVKLSATPCRTRRPAPELGGDTEEVLGGLDKA